MADYYPEISGDDTYETVNTGVNTPGASPGQVFAVTDDWRMSGLRVHLDGVNQGDTIVSANLHLYCAISSRDNLLFDIYAEDVDSPGVFTSDSAHLSSRADANRTDASIMWDNTGGSGIGWYESPSLVNVIQEIVDRPGWSNNGYVALILDPRNYNRGDMAFIALQEDATYDWYLSVVATSGNNPPTVIPITVDGIEMPSITPGVTAEGSDPDVDDLTYNVQITNNPAGFIGGTVVSDSLLTGSGTAIHPQALPGETWLGNIPVDDRVGIGIVGHGGLLKAINIDFGPHETYPELVDGTYLVRVYNALGTPINPVPDPWSSGLSVSVGEYIRADSTAIADSKVVYRCVTSGVTGGTEPVWPVGSGVQWNSVPEGTTVNDGSVVWEVVWPLYPENPADPENTPTPGWIALSDSYPYSPGGPDDGFKHIAFSGNNQIRLVAGQWYMFILDWLPNDYVTNNALAIRTANYADAIAGGNLYLDSTSINNVGPRAIGDGLYSLEEEFDLLDKNSSVAPGFENIDTPSDTQPFNSDEMVTYTVQLSESLAPQANYYWRFRVIDESGSNIWSDWTSTRMFTISDTSFMNTVFEVDQAMAFVVGVSSVVINSAVETDTSVSIVVGAAPLAIQLASETDSSLGFMVGSPSIIILPALETDSSLGFMVGSSSIIILPALETEGGVGFIVGVSSTLIESVVENNVALPFIVDSAVLVIGVAEETDEALDFTIGKPSISIGVAVESDNAVEVVIDGGPVVIHPALETLIALAFEENNADQIVLKASVYCYSGSVDQVVTPVEPSFDLLVFGTYGIYLELTVRDVETLMPVNISTYGDQKEFLITTPSGETYVKPASFKTDGTDGVIRSLVQPSDFQSFGVHGIQVVLLTAFTSIITFKHFFRVIN